MAAPDGQINVELKLLIEAALKDARKAAANMAKEFSDLKINPMAKVAADTDKAASSQAKMTKEVKETSKALTEAAARAQRLKDIASGKISPVQPGQVISISGSSATTKTYGPGAIIPGGIGGQATATKPLTTLAQPQNLPTVNNPLNNMLRRQLLLQPGLPTAQFPALPNAYAGPKPPVLQQTGMMQTIQSSIQQLRNMVLPLGQVLASFYMFRMAINAILAPLRKFASMVADAAAAAHKLYSSAITSGMGIGMTAKRNIYAQVLGVSENDIMMFGRQIQALNYQLEGAAKTAAKVNPGLATMDIEFRVLEANFTRLKTVIVNELSPSVVGLTSLLVELTRGFAILFDELRNVIVGLIKNILSSIGSVLLNPALAAALNTLMTGIVAIGKATIGALGTPQAYMKQMPASAWEHMGLQVGVGGTTNYTQQTAQNTKKTNGILEKLHQAILHNKFNSTMPQGFPATP